MSQKEIRIKKILDDAGKALEAEGVKYFLGAVDRQPKEPDGGKVYTQSDIQGEQFRYILEVAFPTRQDLIGVGIWVGQLLTARDRVQKGSKNGKK